jgi:hypothetical protein
MKPIPNYGKQGGGEKNQELKMGSLGCGVRGQYEGGNDHICVHIFLLFRILIMNFTTVSISSLLLEAIKRVIAANASLLIKGLWSLSNR